MSSDIHPFVGTFCWYLGKTTREIPTKVGDRMRQILAFFAVALVLASWLPARAEESFDIRAHIIAEYYRGNSEFFEKALAIGDLRICKKYVVVDQNSAGDGPLYYLTKADGKVFGVCGGACWNPKAPEQIVACKTKCPPADFECSDFCPNWKCSILQNDTVAAARFLKNGQNVDELIDISTTALNKAAQMGRSYELIKMLIEAGADINSKNPLGYTPLYNYITYNSPNIDIVRLFTKRGLDLEYKQGKEGRNLIEQAKHIASLINIPGAHPSTPSMKEIIDLLEEDRK